MIQSVLIWSRKICTYFWSTGQTNSTEFKIECKPHLFEHTANTRQAQNQSHHLRWQNIEMHITMHSFIASELKLKGKFSSGIEGALASFVQLEHTANIKRQKWFFVFFLYVFKLYLSNIESETAEIFLKRDFEFWAWAPHFIMIWKYNH